MKIFIEYIINWNNNLLASSEQIHTREHLNNAKKDNVKEKIQIFTNNHDKENKNRLLIINYFFY